MKPFWRRKREQAERRRPMPFYQDPDNAFRGYDCKRQMAVFDALPPETRRRLAEGSDNLELVDSLRDVRVRGLSAAARAVLAARGVMACDLSPEQLLAVELETH